MSRPGASRQSGGKEGRSLRAGGQKKPLKQYERTNAAQLVSVRGTSMRREVGAASWAIERNAGNQFNWRQARDVRESKSRVAKSRGATNAFAGSPLVNDGGKKKREAKEADKKTGGEREKS